MSWQRYRTGSADYVTWLDRLYCAVGLRTGVVSLLIGTGVGLVGLVLAGVSGWSALYVRTPAVWLGMLGIALTADTLRRSSVRVHRAYEILRPVVVIEDDAYRAVLARWFNQLSGVGVRVATAASAGLALGVISVAFWWPAAYERFPCLRPPTVPRAWYEDHPVSSPVVLLVYGAAVASLLGLGSWAALANLPFMRRVSRLPAVPLPNVVRERARSAIRFYTFVAGRWFLALGLVGALLVGEIDILAGSLIAMLAILGITLFLVPQVFFRRLILSSYGSLCTIALRVERLENGVTLHERERTKSQRMLEATSLTDLVQMTARPRTWVYDSDDLAWFAVVQVSAVLVVLFSAVLSKWLLGTS